jgi:hypothetical protein
MESKSHAANNLLQIRANSSPRSPVSQRFGDLFSLATHRLIGATSPAAITSKPGCRLNDPDFFTTNRQNLVKNSARFTGRR